MKAILFPLVLTIINHVSGGTVPASTTLIRSSSTITHSPSLIYNQNLAPVAVSYSAPFAYSRAVAPAVYSQQFLSPAQYISPVLTHGPLFAQQSVIAQYPGLIAQSPVVAQYPFVQSPVISQRPEVVEGPSQIPAQVGSPIIEPVDSPQITLPQAPVQAPQQSPILSGGSPGTTVDDDTVSVESA